MDNRSRDNYGKKISTLSVGINLLLSVSKIACGAATGLYSVLADGVNNLSDAGAGIVSFIGFKLAEKPADDSHPFGHARSEYIAGLTVSFLVMLAGYELFMSGIEKLRGPGTEDFSAVTLIVMALSLLLKGTMVVICGRAARQMHSGTIRAVGQDSLTDCLVTGAVAVSAAVTHFAGTSLDGYMTLLVAVFVFRSGFELVRDTMRPLMGEKPPEELVDALREKILSYEGVLGIHDLMIHDYGPGHVFASVHVEVPGQRSVESCHEVIDRIEKDVLEQMRVHLLIHYDPVDGTNALEQKLLSTVRAHDGRLADMLSLHDVNVEDGKLYFDAVIPEKAHLSDAEIADILTRVSRTAFPELEPEISIDHGLVALDNDPEDRK